MEKKLRKIEEAFNVMYLLWTRLSCMYRAKLINLFYNYMSKTAAQDIQG